MDGAGDVTAEDARRPVVPFTRRLAAGAAALTAWEGASRLGWFDPLLMPAPSAVLATLVAELASGRLWPHLATTLIEGVGGLILGIAIGAVIGVGAAAVPWIADLVQPVMALLNTIPRVILAPLLIAWFGIGIASKVALSVVLVAVTIFFALWTGVREVDARLLDRVRTLGGGRWDRVREVYVPSVATWVLGSLKIAVGFAFTGAVVGEFVASSRGLGYLLSFAQSTYNMKLVFSLILVIVVVTLAIFTVFERLERRVLRWRRGSVDVGAPRPAAAETASGAVTGT